MEVLGNGRRELREERREGGRESGDGWQKGNDRGLEQERRQTPGRDWSEGLAAHEGLREDKTGLAERGKRAGEAGRLIAGRNDSRARNADRGKIREKERKMGKRRRTRGKQEVIGEVHENKRVPVETKRHRGQDGPGTDSHTSNPFSETVIMKPPIFVSHEPHFVFFISWTSAQKQNYIFHLSDMKTCSWNQHDSFIINLKTQI